MQNYYIFFVIYVIIYGEWTLLFLTTYPARKIQEIKRSKEKPVIPRNLLIVLVGLSLLHWDSFLLNIFLITSFLMKTITRIFDIPIPNQWTMVSF